MNKSQRTQRVASLLLAVSMLCGGLAWADGGGQTTHERMKDCMAKQKASDSGRPKEEMKKACRDLIGIEKQNAERAAKPPK